VLLFFFEPGHAALAVCVQLPVQGASDQNRTSTQIVLPPRTAKRPLLASNAFFPGLLVVPMVVLMVVVLVCVIVIVVVVFVIVVIVVVVVVVVVVMNFPQTGCKISEGLGLSVSE